jgi:hypothetical protein
MATEERPGLPSLARDRPANRPPAGINGGRPAGALARELIVTGRAFTRNCALRFPFHRPRRAMAWLARYLCARAALWARGSVRDHSTVDPGSVANAALRPVGSFNKDVRR